MKGKDKKSIKTYGE